MSIKENEKTNKAVFQFMKSLLQASSFVESLTEFMKHNPKANGVPPPPLELPYDETKPTINLHKTQEIKVKPVDFICH